MYRSLALIVLNGEKLGEFTFFPNQTMAMLQDNEILELSISCRRNLKIFRKSSMYVVISMLNLRFSMLVPPLF